MDKNYIVVGDNYKQFSIIKNVITYSELLCRDDLEGDECFEIGQGLSLEQRVRVVDHIISLGIDDIKKIDEIAPVALTHKTSSDNVLITKPVKLSDKCYQFGFVVGDQSDRLSDHITGKHLGAMLLIEAARQATIFTLEVEYLQDSVKQWGMTLQQIESRFMHFAFPVQSIMTVNLIELSMSEKKISTIMKISFQQAGKTICEISLYTDLFAADLFKKIEQKNAIKILEFSLKNLEDTYKVPEYVT